MPGTKSIVFAFAPFREAGEAPHSPVRVNIVTPSREYLVTVRLVAHIPYKLVFGRVENMVERHGKFHHAKAGAKVPPIDRNIVDYEIPEFLTQLHQLRLIQLLQIVRTVNRSQKFSGLY